LAPDAVGYRDDLGQASSKTAGFLSGQRITLSAPATLRSFGLISRQVGTAASMGLYRDMGATPAQLVAQAADQAITVAARMEFPASPAVTGGSLFLTPGTYWLMAMYDATTSIAAAAAGTTPVTRRTQQQGWGDLPATLTTAEQPGVPATNYYILITPHF
jgi:hypothetical protein